MSTTNSNLAELLAILRAHNITKYETPELKLEFGPPVLEFPKESLKEREEREAAEEDEVAFAHVSG